MRLSDFALNARNIAPFSVLTHMHIDHPRTLFDKIWDSHIVKVMSDGQTLLYIDRHVLHEGATPLAFASLRASGRTMRRPDAMLGTIDHTIPTRQRDRPPFDPQARAMMAAFHRDTRDFAVAMFDEFDRRQGVVHVVSAEQGFSLPGSVMVCGDSHTSTNGAFGSFAFGVGASEVEHVFATRTLWRTKPRNMLVRFNGEIPLDVTAKDLALTVINRLGTSGGTGFVIEYAGDAIRALSMEGRMTLCNMSIEAGARAGLIAPDESTFAYLKGRPLAPKGDLWDLAEKYWKNLPSDEGAVYDQVLEIVSAELRPMITWGTTPADVVAFGGSVPDPAEELNIVRRASMERSLAYMGLRGGMRLADVVVDHVFIGSCTNGRIEDLRSAANVLRGRKVASGVRLIVVPGSGLVREAAEAEGLRDVFVSAGAEWRHPGCSMCLAMNDDILEAGQRCVSTSNRNFEGRQGRGSRTHLASPAVAAAVAITGRIADF